MDLKPNDTKQQDEPRKDDSRGRATSNNVHFIEHEGADDSVYLMDSDKDDGENSDINIKSPDTTIMEAQVQVKKKLDFNAVNLSY
jgi:hypothetical protein